jgi:hypothetical protein
LGQGEHRCELYGDSLTICAQDYERAQGSAEAAKDPFAIHLDQDETLKKMYLDQEQHDGYIRDMNCFAPGIGIEDDMSVLVRYANDAIMTYHLTAYSPWEGVSGISN